MYSLLEARICTSRLYRRLKSDQTVGAECRQAFKDLLQSLVQWIYKVAGKMPVGKILDVISRWPLNTAKVKYKYEKLISITYEDG